ncbi:undecaprenyl-phosphate glucose phosphotransferase [Teredinibacter waterburyi]|uniref:undecaprenyl-phosphate glucose phosphotransferase n=1 Tax=Teredinibacter waterburyi TaxID=1500538 RepID=UPI00165FD33E|nr:undecaprenyl-phosphate glucose phosphotransferase [Teredinibacter waterburyi]
MSNIGAIEIRPKRLLRNHDTFNQWVQHILNITCVCATLILLTYSEVGEFTVPYRSLIAFTILLMVMVYKSMGVYRRFDNLDGGIRLLCRAWGVVLILLGALSLITGVSDIFLKNVIVEWGVLSIVFQISIYFVTYKIHVWYSRRVQKRIPTLVVGAGAMAKHLAERLNSNIWLPDEVVGVLTRNAVPIEWETDKYKLLGNIDQIADVVKRLGIRRVYVALAFHNTEKLKDIQEHLKGMHVDLIWAPDIFSLNLLNHSVREMAGVPLINLNETPLLAGGPAFLKYTLDKIVSVLALVMLAPLLAVIALIIKSTSKGPIIFKQIRDGWDGKQFYVYKFRSMYMHDDDEVVKQATKGDSRITPIGAFIRRTSIDELPQLFNVLEGSMSLVGPRPHAVSHNQFYSSRVKEYLARHRIKPGMTGLAQINGLRGETDTLEAMEARVLMDLEYIKNWSLSLDLKILLKTPLSLVSKNAY